MKALLDTSVVIAASPGELEGDVAVSSVTLAELHFGVLVTKNIDVRAERLRRLTILEHLFDPLPVDADVARSYGMLAAAVTRAGRKQQARVADLLIAATAHANDARLYTRNPADLLGLESLIEIVAI